MPFGRPIELNDIRLTTWPAGHVLGSAMLLAERDGQRLLYTGDFRLGPSATAERCELPRADVLITESTFGSPRYRLPPHPEAAETLIDLVRGILAGGRTPVVFAYVLGKAQEVTKILTGAGIPVVQHPAIFEISKIYERVGCPLGALSLWEDQCPAGSVLIVPPMGQRGRRIELFAGKVTIGVTGWGIDPSAKYRFGLDHVVPLSDHCDFDQLLRAIEQVGPRVIYVTHGPVGFTDRLRALGLDARPIDGPIQHRLF